MRPEQSPTAAPGTRIGKVVLFLAALFLCAGQARAQAPADALRLYVERAVAGTPGRVEVSVGRLDDRLQLAPCARVEPYVPAGARLWGRTQIGLRCLEGANWNVYLPVEVRVYAHALVATRQIAYGATVSPEDAKVEEVELTRESGTAVADFSLLDGRTATRMLAPGQVLRAEYFRAPPAVGAGDTVRLVLNGSGFMITASGRALGAAADGQPVRVQTDSGRVVQGIARAGRTVEMRL
jgi:flagella basal body P-ring formation protein FlgA